MTGKERATRQSVPARTQKTKAARVHLAKDGGGIRWAETTNDAGIRRPTASASTRSAIWKLEEAKAKRCGNARSSGAPMTRDPNTSPCAASRRSQSSTPPNSNDCCHPTPRSFRSFNSWKASMSKAWI